MPKPSINVVYLCYIPYGIQHFTAFIGSYKCFEAGVLHELVIVFKGQQRPDETQPFEAVLEKEQIAYQQLSYTGIELDIGTYFWAASQLECEDVFFLNTQSILLAPNWLQYFFTASTQQANKVFSATGSWQSLVTTTFVFNRVNSQQQKPFKEKLINMLELVKAATIWWYCFPLFPNPHIRTNAFYINRQLFLSFQKSAITKKMQAFRFESGRNGFTALLKKRGYEVAIISKTGHPYSEETWPDSKIYYIANQENLLVSDNQSKFYTNAHKSKKSLLRKLVWG